MRVHADARESIYILDWWLSPEIYLRRPPSANEQYRLDNMLKAAAERGVKVSIIVYKEVEKALTCECPGPCPRAAPCVGKPAKVVSANTRPLV